MLYYSITVGNREINFAVWVVNLLSLKEQFHSHWTEVDMICTDSRAIEMLVAAKVRCHCVCVAN
jgi:hypothetical protein